VKLNAFEAGEANYEIDAKSLPVGLHMFIVSSGSEYKSDSQNHYTKVAASLFTLIHFCSFS